MKIGSALKHVKGRQLVSRAGKMLRQSRSTKLRREMKWNKFNFRRMYMKAAHVVKVSFRAKRKCFTTKVHTRTIKLRRKSSIRTQSKRAMHGIHKRFE